MKKLVCKYSMNLSMNFFVRKKMFCNEFLESERGQRAISELINLIDLDKKGHKEIAFFLWDIRIKAIDIKLLLNEYKKCLVYKKQYLL